MADGNSYLLALEVSMKKWGMAAGVLEEYEARTLEIRHYYDLFFTKRFYHV